MAHVAGDLGRMVLRQVDDAGGEVIVCLGISVAMNCSGSGIGSVAQL